MGNAGTSWKSLEPPRAVNQKVTNMTPATVMDAAETNAKALQKHQQDEQEWLDSIERNE